MCIECSINCISEVYHLCGIAFHIFSEDEALLALNSTEGRCQTVYNLFKMATALQHTLTTFLSSTELLIFVTRPKSFGNRPRKW